MIELMIPGRGSAQIQQLVSDADGTLVQGGQSMPGVLVGHLNTASLVDHQQLPTLRR